MLTFLMFFTICVFGILAFHIGTAKLMRLGIHYGTLIMTLASSPYRAIPHPSPSSLAWGLIHSPFLLE
jgi:hypothetical protein